MAKHGTESTVPHGAAVGAELNAPLEVTLFHTSGKTVRVAEDDAAFWLDQGFRREPADLTATVGELKALFPEALDAIVRYVTGVQADGTIDPADDAAKATAEYAMRRLEKLWGQLDRDINYQHPVKQGQGVAMLMPDGSATEVDPTQVDHYVTQGWTKA